MRRSFHQYQSCWLAISVMRMKLERFQPKKVMLKLDGGAVISWRHQPKPTTMSRSCFRSFSIWRRIETYRYSPKKSPCAAVRYGRSVRSCSSIFCLLLRHAHRTWGYSFTYVLFIFYKITINLLSHGSLRINIKCHSKN